MKILLGKLTRSRAPDVGLDVPSADRNQKVELDPLSFAGDYMEQSALGRLCRCLIKFLHKNDEPKRENECRHCGSSMATFYSLGVHECFNCKRQYGIKDGIQIRHQR